MRTDCCALRSPTVAGPTEQPPWHVRSASQARELRSPVAIPLAPNRVLAFATYGSALYAARATGVYLSTDNGSTWTTINNGMTNTYVNALAMIQTEVKEERQRAAKERHVIERQNGDECSETWRL